MGRHRRVAQASRRAIALVGVLALTGIGCATDQTNRGSDAPPAQSTGPAVPAEPAVVDKMPDSLKVSPAPDRLAFWSIMVGARSPSGG